MPPENGVDGSMSKTHTTINSTLPHALIDKCKHFMAYTYRGWRGIMRIISENWKKNATVDSNLPQCEGRFGEMTTWAAVLDFDDPSWHWKERPAMVRSDFVGEQSQGHFMSILSQRKHIHSIHIDSIASNGGVTTFFPRVYIRRKIHLVCSGWKIASSSSYFTPRPTSLRLQVMSWDPFD